MNRAILILFLVFANLPCFSQFIKGSFMIEGKTLPYQISYPNEYDSTKKYPLLVFLHGAGERGNDNELQLNNGRDFLENTQTNFPAIVIAPQCPNSSYWANVVRNSDGEKLDFIFGATDNPSPAMETLEGLVKYWTSSGKVDTSRVYLGGLSMGGMGTYELLWRMPSTFAAAFAICGGGDTLKVSRYAKTCSVWIFYGESDPVVSPHYSQEMYRALTSVGCDVKISSYPNVGHNSWDNAFSEPQLLPWLFSKSRN